MTRGFPCAEMAGTLCVVSLEIDHLMVYHQLQAVRISCDIYLCHGRHIPHDDDQMRSERHLWCASSRFRPDSCRYTLGGQ